MIKFLGIMSVLLFWVTAIALSPLILLIGILIFILSIFFAVSSVVYDIATQYLKRNLK